MKYRIIITLVVLACSITSFAQVGIGTTTPNSNATLELLSNSQGMLFPRLTSTQRDAIASPANGLTIFNTTLNCIQTNIGSSAVANWKCLGGISPSSNGSAIVSAYTCNTASAGTLTAGTSVSGVTQTITATVIAAGTYSISATANGVTFSGTGTFTGTGVQNIVLTATGTPTYGTTDAFTLNTTPNCTFNRTAMGNASTNGTAIVSSYNCSTASAGTLTVGTAATGVTQTITATVTTTGTYNISTTANGVTFAASGTFAGDGSQNIVLTATGTPSIAGSITFTLNTSTNCNFDRNILQASTNGTAIVSAYNNSSATGSLTAGSSASGATQTINATATTVGTYNISSTANGVTFAGTGTFTGTGSQNILLTATGTPTVAGIHTFTLNTTPNCNFNRTTITIPGAPTIPVATAGNAQASIAFVAPVANGGSAITGYTVTSSPGSFTSTGTSSPLIVTGLTNGTAYTFTVIASNAAGNSVASTASAAITPTTFLCGTTTVTFTYKGTSVTYGTVSSAGGKCWLDRNLGATRVAISSTDAAAYGDLFQWGRAADGHQIRTSGTTTTRSTSDLPGHANFIKNNTNWRTTMNDNLWQGVNGVNNPCPNGFRVPTMTELNNELGSWISANQAGAYNSPLKLPADGDRHGGNGSVNAGGYGNYWSSNVIVNSNAYYLNINISSYIDNWSRSWGMPIRCIKD